MKLSVVKTCVTFANIYFKGNFVVKINQTPPGGAEPTAGVARKKIDRVDNIQKGVIAKNDHVHISTPLAGIQTLGANNGIVDAAKIAEIKQAISEGHFKVNSDVVADRLLETVKELIQSK